MWTPAVRPACAVLLAVVVLLGAGARAARACVITNDDDVAALVSILQDPAKGTGEKGDACLKLMEMGPRAKPAVPALTNLLQAKDQDMRDFAITTLSKIGPAAKAALPALRKVAEADPVPEIRSLAEDAVRAISGGAAPAEPDEERPAARPAAPERKQPTPAAPQRKQPAAPAKPADAPTREAPVPAFRGPLNFSAMASVYPELARLPAPDWVKPGVRFTYYAAAATIAGKGPIFQLDPQGPIFATDGSGKRYSVKPGSREEGAGGHGFGEYTIVSTGSGVVAVAADVYTITAPNNSPRMMSRGAYVGAPGCTADLWVNPGWLKQVKAGMDKSLRVLRMKYKVGNAMHPAVAFTTPSSDMVFVYDETDGMLLYRGGSGEGEKGMNLRVNGQQMPNSPSRMLTLSTLVGRRSPGLPWAGQAPPSWVRSVSALHYAGQVGVLVPGSPNVPLPMTTDLRVVARGADWVRFHSSMTAGGTGGAMPVREETEWMAGRDQLGGVWIGPQALAALQAGQVIDRDPLTSFVTTVRGTVRSPNGGTAVVISRVGPDQQIDYAYDTASGVLVSIDRQDRGVAGTMRGTLVLRGQE